MAAAASTTPRATRTTITKEDVTDEKRLERSKYYKETDFWELVAEVVGKENHIARVYRADERWENSSAPIDNKLTEPFTEETIYQRFGGGRYNIWLYRGASLVRPTFHLELEGVPKSPSQQAAASTVALDPHASSTDMLIRELLAEIRMGRGQNFQQEAVRSALDLNRQALTGAADTLRQLNPPAAAPGGMDEDKFLDRLMKFKTLFDRPTENPLNVIQTFAAIAEAMKGITGANVKADWSSTLLANAPALLDKVVGGMREYRLASEAQARIPQPGVAPVAARTINLDDSAPSQPPPAAPAAPQPVTQEPTEAKPGSLPWFLLKLEAGIVNPESTGQDLYEFVVSCKVTGLIAEADFNVLTADKPTVAATLQNLYNHVFGENNEHLKRITADPARLEKLLDEYIAAAQLDRDVPGVTAAAPKPN